MTVTATTMSDSMADGILPAYSQDPGERCEPFAPGPKIDVLVVAALKEELDAFREIATSKESPSKGVREWKEIKLTDEVSYELGHYLIEDRVALTIALARPERMGGIATAPVATLLADRLKPDCLAMCGVCAGNPKDTALGDVIIANPTFQWDEGKAKDGRFEADIFTNAAPALWGRLDDAIKEGGLSSFGTADRDDACLWFYSQLYTQRNEKKPASPMDNLAFSRYFSEKMWPSWLRHMESEKKFIRGAGTAWKLTPAGVTFVEEQLRRTAYVPRKLPLRIHVGPMASGNFVAADGKAWSILAEDRGQRKVIGLEMEAASIGFVARVLGIKKWIVMKGVMDYADTKKENGFKSFAARASAEALMAFIIRKVLPSIPKDRAGVRPSPKAPPSARGAFDFNPGQDQLSVLVVCREQGSHDLESVVKSTIKRLQDKQEFTNIANKQISAGENYLRENIFFMHTADSFENLESFTGRLRAICRADVVVFDVTSGDGTPIEPGMMLFLGVRSVVRRGVSICSVDCDPERLFGASLPYNLQHLNISSHAGGTDAKNAVVEQMADKLMSGFEDLAKDPFYLDLPSFDAIRHLGGTEEDYRPIPYLHGPLYLGPFDALFQARFFTPVRDSVLSILCRERDSRMGRNFFEPRFYRLMDYKKARMVSQSLYHAIRRHNFCLIDWTNYRPNVFFEFGVRLACRSSGDVHIIARSTDDPRLSALAHVQGLARIFSPVEYDPDDEQQMDKVAEYIVASYKKSVAVLSQNAVLFRAIAQAVVPPRNPVTRMIAEFLRKRAAFSYIHSPDQLLTTVLFEDHNPGVQRAAAVEAATFKAAELFLRSSDGEPREDIAEQLEELAQAIGRLQSRNDTEHDVEVLRRCVSTIQAQVRNFDQDNQ